MKINIKQINPKPHFANNKTTFCAYGIQFEDIKDGIPLQLELMSITGPNWTIKLFLEEAELLRIDAISDIVVSDDHRNEMLRVLNYLNSKITSGCFYLCRPDCGRVMFRHKMNLVPGAEDGTTAELGFSQCVVTINEFSWPLAKFATEESPAEEFDDLLHARSAGADAGL